MTEFETIRVVIVPIGVAPFVHDIIPTVRTYGALVGGYFEAIGVGGRWTCYLNEDGKTIGYPPNDAATAAWLALGFEPLPGDYCAGPAMFCGPPDAEGGDTDVTAEVLAHFGLT